MLIHIYRSKNIQIYRDILELLLSKYTHGDIKWLHINTQRLWDSRNREITYKDIAKILLEINVY